MNTFLHAVAQDLVARFGADMSQLTIIFPGKRAQLFMSRLLAQAAGRPVWSPQYLTLSDVMQSLTDLQPSDTVRNVCTLHRIYKRLVPDGMDIDTFYCWGEILMSDFDDIDKHMVPADKLFANIADLSDMDTADYLTPEQEAALRQFFSTFSAAEQSEVKRRFAQMWRAMPQMYRQLNHELRAKGLAYPGALQRAVAEGLVSQSPNPLITQFPNVAVVGFNVLNEVEEVVFGKLKEAGALFYWDYDDYYVSQHPQHQAGTFMRQNLSRYPDALGGEHDHLGKPKQITYVATDSNDAQARYVAQWLRQGGGGAVILCDERLLPATLHAIPGPGEEPWAPTAMNVTMGYPLSATPAHSFCIALLELQTYGWDTRAAHFRRTAVSRVTAHPLYCDQPIEYHPDNGDMLAWLGSCLEQLGQGDTDDALHTEAVFRIFQTVTQFRQLVDGGTLAVERPTLCRLMTSALRSASVPFHGDMADGLQVMGLLETRNLDFSRFVMLSTQEGYMPKRPSETSLIPYALRTSFGLNTIERQTAVFAYYFHRVLQRADDATFVYCDQSNTGQCEPSRFLLQLQGLTDWPIAHVRLQATPALSTTAPISIDKTPQVMEALRRRYDAGSGGQHDISPSALGTYLTCPLRFYLQNVVQLADAQREVDDEVDAVMLGTLFHDAAEMFYSHLPQLTGTHTVTAADLTPALDPPYEVIRPYVDLAFWVDLFQGRQYDAYQHREQRAQFLAPFMHSRSRTEFADRVASLYSHPSTAAMLGHGINMIIRRVLTRYLDALLRCDHALTPFSIYGLEKSVHSIVEIDTADGQRSIRIGGRVDRLDVVTRGGLPTLRIVDYKTGTVKTDTPSDIPSLFNPLAEGREHYYIQTLLYCALMRDREPSMAISPALFYMIAAMGQADYDPTLQLGKGKGIKRLDDVGQELIDEFMDELRRVVTEIFDPTIPFAQGLRVPKCCEFCAYRPLCGIQCKNKGASG